MQTRWRRGDDVLLPLAPFRQWIEERERQYPTFTALAASCGAAERRLYAYKHGFENVSKDKGGGRHPITTITLTTADQYLTREGTSALKDVWPFLYGPGGEFLSCGELVERWALGAFSWTLGLELPFAVFCWSLVLWSVDVDDVLDEPIEREFEEVLLLAA
jgi:hypothetical protein